VKSVVGQWQGNHFSGFQETILRGLAFYAESKLCCSILIHTEGLDMCDVICSTYVEARSSSQKVTQCQTVSFWTPNIRDLGPFVRVIDPLQALAYHSGDLGSLLCAQGISLCQVTLCRFLVCATGESKNRAVCFAFASLSVYRPFCIQVSRKV
jgi:hypothetical protein